MGNLTALFSNRFQTALPINALWGDFHVSFSTTKQAFDPKLWDPGDNDASMQDPGDNTTKFRTIISLLRP